MNKVAKVLLGILPGVDPALCFIKAIYYKFQNPMTKASDPGWLVMHVKRCAIIFKALLEFAMIGLCIAAVLGSTLVPIPGVTPIVGLGSLGILQVAGASLGWIYASRLVGVVIGDAFDRALIGRYLPNTSDVKKFRSGKNWLKTLCMAFVGELGYVTVTKPTPSKKTYQPEVKSKKEAKRTVVIAGGDAESEAPVLEKSTCKSTQLCKDFITTCPIPNKESDADAQPPLYRSGSVNADKFVGPVTSSLDFDKRKNSQ